MMTRYWSAFGQLLTDLPEVIEAYLTTVITIIW